MKLHFKGQYQSNPRMLMRRCSYAEIRTREVSYARRLGGLEYPRFHAYVELTDDGFTVNLHLDQKRPSYGTHTAHSGEYEGELVESEGRRIKTVIEGMRLKK
ncbi:MAG: hypothetical protein A3C90_02990 [Candidatus Magasanikbacteria bacterium RIFCSPHIGHO2_02_FULL_51_14]|uniref:CYTH domain-containing protein n=1 Tax=Candidatus Magasanikbacteria bacterium RIFCSPHIGHO2_02_FULL_51_14 TaxID=1798683 RepID=A0A1F6MFC8_9BACT|nr:MAG: hypothetical protein A3C90_02990 [Candidatus Magasanikbacteria bacterium RIFCSPHIGHO2_02_FULL_51_14]